MKEISDIVAAFDQAVLSGTSCALATVVHVDGSSYRRPGARMLITSEGQLTGAISGGCLEGDALRKAQLVMLQKQPMLVTYDTNDEDDARLGMGLGCNGIIHVLIEPVDVQDPSHPIAFLKKLLEKRQHAILVTAFYMKDKKNLQPGTCFALLEDGTVVEQRSSAGVSFASDAQQAILCRSSSFRKFDHEGRELTAFIQYIRPSVSLIILGAGNDVQPLVSFANTLGWETTVLDGRPAYATSARFPNANRVMVKKPEAIDAMDTDAQTVFLLMTHNYNYDIAALRSLVKKDLSYVGMLGPKNKLERMKKELKEEHDAVTDEMLSVIHTPAGLDIGAETPEEIALSIIAEIQAVMSEKTAASLKSKEDAIHDRRSLIIK